MDSAFDIIKTAHRVDHDLGRLAASLEDKDLRERTLAAQSYIDLTANFIGDAGAKALAWQIFTKLSTGSCLAVPPNRNSTHRSSSVLVPKLCLGMHLSSKLRFAASGSI